MQREEVLAFLKGGRGSNSRVRVATPTAAAVAGAGGPGEDIAWLPTPEEATSTRIKHCREFQAYAKEQIRPVPVVMHREIVAGLDSRGEARCYACTPAPVECFKSMFHVHCW